MADEKDDKTLAEYGNVSSGFTNAELDKIVIYREAGLPGIIEVTDHKLMEAYGMRLDGRSWLEISKSLKISKIAVMHFGEKFEWHKKRLEYLDGYEMHLREQIMEEKIHNQYFMRKAMYVFRRKIGKKFDTYLSTGDESNIDTIDMKQLQVYLKLADEFGELDAKNVTRNQDNTPAVGFTLPDNVTIKRLSDGTVEITPKQKSTSEMLAELMKSKKDQKNQN
jgi:hypothetical protein